MQDVREEMVIAKPLTTAVEADQKQIRAVQLLERFVTAVIVSERVAKWTT